MSPIVTGWLLLAALAAAPPQVPAGVACNAAAEAVLAATAEAVARGEYVAAAERVRSAYDNPDTAGCRALRLAAWAWRGWTSAEGAAARGGAPEALAQVTEAITAVTAFGPARSEAAYAAAVLHAAAAAAQDERDEMQVWLDEARAVSTRLALLGAAPAWPLPIDVAEGELWHGVDDYELAEASFTRALAARETAAAWRGLARARDRRGNRIGACDAYRRVQALLATAPASSSLAAEARGYLLVCAP